MDKIETLDNLEEFKKKFEAVHKTSDKTVSDAFSQYCKSKGLGYSIFGIGGESQKTFTCKKREEVYSSLPKSISVTPEIALFFAEDHHLAVSKAKEVKFPILKVLYNMSKPAMTVIFPNPFMVMSAVDGVRSGIKDMAEYSEKLQKIASERNELVREVLGVYSLIESASVPGQYELKRGSYYFHAGSGRDSIITEGWLPIGPPVDLEKLRETVALRAEKSQSRSL